MRATKLFTKTTKTTPADETSKNAQLLIKAGFINKEMAGVYTFLPLGKRVLDKVVQIIREEMDAIGGNEISLTALQPKEVWQATNRWMFGLKLNLLAGVKLDLPLHTKSH